MSSLPWELVSDICLIAASNDQHTASQLCLTNQALKKIIIPILYKRVRLDGTESIDQFNKTIMKRTSLCKYVEEITLEDTQSILDLNLGLRDIHFDGEAYPSWQKPWISLFVVTMNTLIQDYNFKVLIISEMACHSMDSFEGEELHNLLSPETNSNLEVKVLRNLVIYNSEKVWKVLQMVGKAERFTWYGCGHRLCECLESHEVIRWFHNRLNELVLMVGNDGFTDYKIHGVHWEYSPLDPTNQLSMYSTRRSTRLRIRINIHRRAPGMKARVKKDYGENPENPEFIIGDWGKATDENDFEAHDNSHTRREYMDCKSVLCQDGLDTSLIPSIEEQRKWNIGDEATFPYLDPDQPYLGKLTEMPKGIPKELQRWDGRDKDWCKCNRKYDDLKTKDQDLANK